jgi:hypothetical protein
MRCITQPSESTFKDQTCTVINECSKPVMSMQRIIAYLKRSCSVCSLRQLILKRAYYICFPCLLFTLSVKKADHYAVVTRRSLLRTRQLSWYRTVSHDIASIFLSGRVLAINIEIYEILYGTFFVHSVL